MGLTELIIQKSYEDVLVKGREEGEIKEMDKKTIQVITNLHHHNPTLSDERIADLAGTSIGKVKAIRATLTK